MSFSADGARLASGDGGGSICLWGNATGALLIRMRAGYLGVKSQHVSRGTARAEDAQGTPTQSHISPSIPVYEDNRLLASVRGQDVAVWDMAKGEERGRKLPAGGFAEFSPDGRTIATVGGIPPWRQPRGKS